MKNLISSTLLNDNKVVLIIMLVSFLLMVGAMIFNTIKTVKEGEK